jgi:hypothetical protein
MAIHIKADGDITEVHPTAGDKFTLEEMQAAVGGLIELIILHDGRDMWINEEGLILGLPFNISASTLYGKAIMGDVLVTSRSETR